MHNLSGSAHVLTEAFSLSCASRCLLVKSMCMICTLIGLCLSLFLSAQLASNLDDANAQTLSCSWQSSALSFPPPSFPIYSLFSARKAALVNSSLQLYYWLTSLQRWIEILAGLLCNPRSCGPSSLVFFFFSAMGIGSVKK